MLNQGSFLELKEEPRETSIALKTISQQGSIPLSNYFQACHSSAFVQEKKKLGTTTSLLH